MHETSLCPQIVLRGEVLPDFSETERRMLCGDSPRGDPIAKAWASIPFSQARFHLDAFLQEKGYFTPQFTVAEGRLFVEPGSPARVTVLRGENIPAEVALERKRDIVGRRLTPSVLDESEQWVSRRLQEAGYGCPEVSSTADSGSGELRVTARPGTRQNVVRILEENTGGIAPGVLGRYYAFRLGQQFDASLLALSERRIRADGVLQGVDFTSECEEGGVVLRQSGTAGPPRLLSFGFGINTEGLLLLKSTFRNTRIGRRASLFDVTVQGSSKSQQINTSMDWYHLPFPSRRFLRPSLGFRHQNEEPFEISEIKGRFHQGTSLDVRPGSLSLRIGPTIEFVRKLRGSGPRDSHFFPLELNARWMSHWHEYSLRSPRSGFSAELITHLNTRQVLSDANAQRLQFKWDGLWNYKDYDPPLWILGLRGGVAAVASGERPGPESGLPPNFFQYLGGSKDLRGFGREEISNAGNGFMSAAFAGVEWRWSDSPLQGLLKGLQPFFFTDAGRLGERPFSLDPTLYWSPGFGMRWDSPIGAFRGTLAHGFVSPAGAEDLEHFQFFLSFGEEF